MIRDDQVPAGFEMLDLGIGYARAFGPVFLWREKSIMAFRVAQNHVNPVGGCHGGAMATFADAQIVAVHGASGTADQHTPTINLAMDYLAPAPLGAWVEAEVRLIRKTRTLIFTQAIISTGGEPIARTSAIYRNNKQTGA